MMIWKNLQPGPHKHGSLYGSQPTFVGLPVIKPGASGGLIGTFSLWLTLWHLHSKQPVSSSFLVIFIIR